ncbi:Interleukin-1 receptor-associated kinase 4, partial [Stegodyphus mimosarum]
MTMPVSRMSGFSNISLRRLLPSTKLRNLGMRERRQLVGILSINDGWRDLAGLIRNPDNPNEYLYKVYDISFLESQWKTGRNPAEALLDDWSITGREQPDLNDLLMVLQEAQLLRAAYYVQTELLKLPDDTREAESTSEDIDTILKYRSQSSNTVVADVDTTVKTLEGINISELTVFSYSVLSRATQDFCNLNIGKGGCKIGEGSFGCVYLANISGRRFAVKKLKGDVDKQFFTELKILVRCHHENLVPLLGFSNNGPRCCLVYEYMPNGSLQDRLACVEKT